MLIGDLCYNLALKKDKVKWIHYKLVRNHRIIIILFHQKNIILFHQKITETNFKVNLINQ